MRRKLMPSVLVLAAALISLGQGECEGEFPSGAQSTPNTGTSASNNISITIQPNSTGLGAAAFGTNPLSVGAGTMVTWINNDTTNHSIASTAGVFGSGPLAPGQSFSQTFTQIGTFDYFCGIHGATSETGRILVTAGASPAPNTGATPAPANTPQFPIPAPSPTAQSPTGF